jgi:hypothetical protein
MHIRFGARQVAQDVGTVQDTALDKNPFAAYMSSTSTVAGSGTQRHSHV